MDNSFKDCFKQMVWPAFLIFQVKGLEIIRRVSFIFIVIINPLFAQVEISLTFKSHIQERSGIFLI